MILNKIKRVINRCINSKSLALSIINRFYAYYKENLIVRIVYFSNKLLTFRF